MANDKQGRGAPQLYRDFYGVLYIIVDDAGEPVSDYSTSLGDLRDLRDNAESDGRSWSGFRIAEVGYKVVGVDEPDGVTIADDPRSEP